MIIDYLIEALKRVKNCDNALNNLHMAYENAIFKADDLSDEHKRWLGHVNKLIFEAIEIIEGDTK